MGAGVGAGITLRLFDVIAFANELTAVTGTRTGIAAGIAVVNATKTGAFRADAGIAHRRVLACTSQIDFAQASTIDTGISTDTLAFVRTALQRTSSG